MLTSREHAALKSLLQDPRNRPGCYLNGDQRVGLDKLLRDYDARALELREHNGTLDRVSWPECPCGDASRPGHPLGKCAAGLGGERRADRQVGA